jgi:hypothetical protein
MHPREQRRKDENKAGNARTSETSEPSATAGQWLFANARPDGAVVFVDVDNFPAFFTRTPNHLHERAIFAAFGRGDQHTSECDAARQLRHQQRLAFFSSLPSKVLPLLSPSDMHAQSLRCVD